MKLLISLVLTFTFNLCSGQDSIVSRLSVVKLTPAVPESNIVVFDNDSSKTIIGLLEKKSEKIDILIEEYAENKKYNGYRIQIFSSSNNKWDAVQAKTEFIKSYPEIQSYLVYNAPNFKVRVGDFLDRLDASKQLLLIQESFPNAFLVKCEVEPKVK